jgi:hypothetical protein
MVIKSMEIFRECRKQDYVFPQILFRQTKKAYISFVTADMLSEFTGKDTVTYNALRLACQRRGLKMDMRFARKVYASWLHQCGITIRRNRFFAGKGQPISI